MDNREQLVQQAELLKVATDQPTTEKVVHSRRRLFRQGASVVAVTLASRPVLAWHCNSPSAVGSLDAVTTKSMQAKHQKDRDATPDETWTINNWIENTGRGFGKPWKTLGYKTRDSDKNDPLYYKKYKVSTLFSGLNIPQGLNGDDFVWEKLSSGSTTEFTKYMIVARLNYKLVPNVKFCLTSNHDSQLGDQLNVMATGSYRIPGSDVFWDQAKIIEYLQENWIVKP